MDPAPSLSPPPKQAIGIFEPRTNDDYSDRDLKARRFFAKITQALTDGVSAPAYIPGWGQFYIDTSDGHLKIIFGDGQIVTLDTTVVTDTIFDAKGDLAVGTGADTAARLPVGTNDQIPMAESAETTGIKWVSPGTPSAVSTANAEGTTDGFTRTDHVHAHEAAHINHDTTWAAKGDLIAGTANDTAAVLPVGSDTQVLTADSTQSTGMKWAAGGGGSTITVQEGDSTVDGSVTTLDFESHRFNVTSSPAGEANIDLSAVYLGNYHPDKPPASPSGTDDEFDDDSISGSWTSVNTPDTLDETTFHGYEYIVDNDGADAGEYIAYSPGANALSFATKLIYDITGASFTFAGIVLTDSSGTGLATLTIQNNGSGSLRFRTGPAGGTNVSSAYYTNLISTPIYLIIQRDSSTGYTVLASIDGLIFTTLTTFTQSGTIARAYIIANGQGGTNAIALFDFVRFFTSQTTAIGGV